MQSSEIFICHQKRQREEDQYERERKQKLKEQRKIKKELREREMKRLWEAQSIQRKLNEVDVKQFELEERATQLEKKLRSGSCKSLINTRKQIIC